MIKLKEILEKLSYTRHTNSESADKQVGEAEQQILETHIPKSSLPSEEEIRKLSHKVYNKSPDYDTIGERIDRIAHAIRERLDD